MAAAGKNDDKNEASGQQQPEANHENGEHEGTPEPIPNEEEEELLGAVGGVEVTNNTEESVPGQGVKRIGRCKWFNVAKGWGFITPEDGGQDVFVHQSVIKMGGFRSLGDDEDVEFECKTSDKGLEATFVSGPKGSECQGSHRRPAGKKRFRKIRCYNCGEFSNHIAAKCTMGPQPKRCHSCKSSDHLVADCPLRPKKELTENNSNSNNDDSPPPANEG